MQFLQHLQQSDPSGASAKFFYDNWVKKQPGVVVNTGDKVETAFGVETGKLDAARNAETFKDVSNAAGSIPSMVEAYKMVPRSATGWGAYQVAGVARIVGKLGYKPGKDLAADTQVMVKLLRDGVIAQLQTRALGSGTAVSDPDRVFMERQSAADITLEPTTIKKIIRINMGLALEKMISTKLEYQQQMATYPQAAQQIQGKIDMIDRKMAQPWTDYWKMISKEQEMESGSTGDVVNSLFPAR
jgi:hypothetical protein